ncbi:MAG TPA: SRPBCC family protein [Pseudomonadales bacterium]|nr:SRPBCC family protein [Pseudomonadales bacterium]
MQNTEFVYATFIRTTPEKLWAALTSGDSSVKYWMGFRIELEQKVGGTIHIYPPKGSTHTCGDHEGKVLECEPNRKLVYTWNQNDQPDVAAKRSGPSRVTYEITPMGEQVRFRLIHENLLPDDMEKNPNTHRGINNGWPAVISSLKSLLETGEAIAFPSNGGK